MTTRAEDRITACPEWEWRYYPSASMGTFEVSPAPDGVPDVEDAGQMTTRTLSVGFLAGPVRPRRGSGEEGPWSKAELVVIAELLVAALTVERFHETLEWVAVDGTRLACPHPGAYCTEDDEERHQREQDMWRWLSEGTHRLVRDYVERWPLGAPPTESEHSRQVIAASEDDLRADLEALPGFIDRVSVPPWSGITRSDTGTNTAGFHLSLTGPLLPDANNPDEGTQVGGIMLDFQGRLSSPHRLARAVVVAEVIQALHEGFEWTKVDDKRLAEPHPGGLYSAAEDAAWLWLTDRVGALVDGYIERYPTSLEDGAGGGEG